MRRRDVLKAASGATIATLSGLPALASAALSQTTSIYRRSIVIDGLGGPGGYETDSSGDAPLLPRRIVEAKASGVTAANVTVSAVGNLVDSFERTIAMIGWWDRELGRHQDAFLAVRSSDDIQVAKTTRRLGLIFGTQDTVPVGPDFRNLSTLVNLGVRVVQLTYNKRNTVGDGCLEPGNAGLSDYGRAMVGELNRRRILVDLSHAGQATIREGILASTQPVTISHTACRQLVDRTRNVGDSELRLLAERGGVVGIFMMPFLRFEGQPHAADYLDHVDHAFKVCGEDHVGIGTDGLISPIEITPEFRKEHRDFVEDRRTRGIMAPGESPDVYNLVPEYNSVDRFERLAGDLAKRGHSPRQIEKFLGGNLLRLYRDVWS